MTRATTSSPFPLRRSLAVTAATALLLLAGCSASTEPGPGPDPKAQQPSTTAPAQDQPADTGPERWTRPTYAAPKLAALPDDRIDSSAHRAFGDRAVRAAYDRFGPWLLRESVTEDRVRQVPGTLSATVRRFPLSRMTAVAAADWNRYIARPGAEGHRRGISALSYFGYVTADPFQGGPVVVNKQLVSPWFAKAPNGKLEMTATVTAELRSTKNGEAVRWPLTRVHRLWLVPAGDGWLMDGWHTDTRVGDPVPDA